MRRSCLPTITHDQTIEQVVLLFQHVVESFHKDSEPSRDSAFSTLLIASSEFYSTHIAKLPDLSRRKFSDFYFFRLDLSPILYGEVCETISLIRKDGTNQQDNMRDLGFKLKLMASCADILKHPDLSAGTSSRSSQTWF